MWSNLDALDATDWLKRIAQGDSVESGVRACLDKIEQTDKHINAFHHVFADNALEQARICDATSAEKRGPLHGLPIAIKEENAIAGIPTAFGTAAMSTPATEDSAVVAALRRRRTGESRVTLWTYDFLRAVPVVVRRLLLPLAWFRWPLAAMVAGRSAYPQRIAVFMD